jgi:hypothetical protein
MVDVLKVEAHNVPEAEASSRSQRVKSLMVAKFVIQKSSHCGLFHLMC